MIPRFEDTRTGVPYERYWKCTKCGWAIGINNALVGKDGCRLCGAETVLIRVDYPEHKDVKVRDMERILG